MGIRYHDVHFSGIMKGQETKMSDSVKRKEFSPEMLQNFFN